MPILLGCELEADERAAGNGQRFACPRLWPFEDGSLCLGDIPGEFEPCRVDSRCIEGSRNIVPRLVKIRDSSIGRTSNGRDLIASLGGARGREDSCIRVDDSPVRIQVNRTDMEGLVNVPHEVSQQEKRFTLAL